MTGIIVGCAKIGSPTGGPKDVDPPRLVKASPPNYSTHFNQKKIEIWFDEYIKLKDANQQLVVSPPMMKKPTLTCLSKSFVIELKDSLKANSTYALNFGNSVVDNNEDNPVENFRYVFSTGSYIDSLSIKGNITGAFDLKPDKDPLIVVLHDNLDDTAVYSLLPTYIGRTDKEGNFRIDNMREGRFRMYAIKDINNNFKYDPNTEAVAFIDSVFHFTYGMMAVDSDSVKKAIIPAMKNSSADKADKKDSTKNKNTLQVTEKPSALPAITLPRLYFFTEKDNRQYIKRTDRKEKQRLDIIFNNPLDSNFWYEGITPVFSNKNVLFERNASFDSLTLWLLDSAVFLSENIKVLFHYYLPDSNKLTSDTITFSYFKKDDDRKKEKNNLKIFPASGSLIDLNGRITIQSDKPILKIDTSVAAFFEKTDTIEYKKTFAYSRDSLNTRLLYLNYKWEPEKQYRIELYPGFITDYYHSPIDTIKAFFTAQKEEYYGNLILNLRNVTSHMIIQMIEKDIVAERFISSDTTLYFNLLKPANYSFKAIFDSNRNKKWDTGDLKKKRQPEKVLFLGEAINVRSNWDVEKTWIIKRD